MWPTTFSARLASWSDLRERCQSSPIAQCLEQIDQWWQSSPWRPYHLHWDDQDQWPDPWQLLSDNYYCDVARGLGILYTITLLDRADLTSTSLVLTNDDRNLVLVQESKYILNWNSNTILNTNLERDIKRRYTQQQVRQKYL